MTEVVEAPVQVSAEPTIQQDTQPSPFAKTAWTDDIPNPTSNEQPKIEGAATAEPPAATPSSSQEPPKTEPIVESDFYQKEFGKDKDSFKKEYDELIQFKNAKPQEIQWANEDSKRVHELLREGKIKEVVDIFNKQEQLERAIKNEVNPQTADEIIKLRMKLTYPTLNDAQIDFQFNEDYGVGRKPVIKDGELEEEYNERLATWNEQVERVNMKKTIAATMAIPELQKLKTEIKLPEISIPITSQQPSQESLEAAKKVMENFKRTLENDYGKVEGFSTIGKNEFVEVPIKFKIPDEAKSEIKGRIQENFDPFKYIDVRWSKSAEEADPIKMATDIFILENFDKILSAVANDAVNQTWHQIKQTTKNTDVNTSGTSQQTFQPGQNGQQNVSPYSKNAWSEKPPLIQN